MSAPDSETRASRNRMSKPKRLASQRENSQSATRFNGAVSFFEPRWSDQANRSAGLVEPSPQQTPREYEERREHKGHQDIAGGCNERRTNAKQGVRHRHPANVDGEKHAPERRHPHQIGGAYPVSCAVNLSMQLGECLVRRKAEPRVRVDGRCAGGRVGRCRPSRRHQHPPPSGRDVGTNDDADRQLRADDAAEIPEQRRACEIDQPADDRRDALRWRPAPGGHRILLRPSITRIATRTTCRPLRTSAELKMRRFPASSASTLGR